MVCAWGQTIPQRGVVFTGSIQPPENTGREGFARRTREFFFWPPCVMGWDSGRQFCAFGCDGMPACFLALRRGPLGGVEYDAGGSAVSQCPSR